MKRILDKTQIIGIALILAYAGFALLPDTFVNWFYDYFLFIPGWGVAACVAVAAGVLFIPKIDSRGCRIVLTAAAVLSLPVLFYCFRTKIHCFGGDMIPGCIPQDLTISLKSFIPALPGKGRLDTYGFWPLFKYLVSSGFLSRYTGMATMVAFGLYDILIGGLFALLSALLFRKSLSVLFMVLTAPFVFNFFGNVDCYPLPICAGMGFLAFSVFVFSRERVSLPLVAGYCAYWLFCGWVHPLAGVVGFLPAAICARWLNGCQTRIRIPERVAVSAFCVLFFAINIISYGKAIFSAPWNDVPPVFSVDTLIHTLNIVILPVVPIALFVLRGGAPAQEKRLCLDIWISQGICFTAAHFTQGANDQFPYALYLMGVLIPWLSLALRHPLEFGAAKVVVALNLLLLIPMVWVHSSELTVARAQHLYPLDGCKHNREMSWQTHLGLVLGDNLIDRSALARATVGTFENGSRHAMPEGFRGGNYVYYIAFLYHYGEFARGKALLTQLVRSNPWAVQYFLGVRPGFAYMNRQRLWDDLCEAVPEGPARRQLTEVLSQLREKAQKERYCLRNPRFAVCPY